ncbi:MAG: MFS transporter, partial [Pseudonocardia sp.]
LTVLRVRGSAAVVGTVALGAASLAVVEPVLPPHLATRFDTGALLLGLLFAVAVVSGALLNPLVGGLLGRVDARLLGAAGVAGVAVALLALGLAQQMWLVWAGMAVLGVASAFLLAPATTLIGVQGAHADPPALGGAYALFNLAYAAGLMIGPLLAGVGTGFAGFPAALAGLACLVTALGVPAVRWLPTGLEPARR